MTLEILEPYETLQTLPAGKVLFREGEPADGVYLVHFGRVELVCSNKPLALVEEGEILGLTTVMSGRAHDTSAVTRGACTVGFVEKAFFLRLLDEQPALWLTVLRMISENISACWQSMRALAAR